MGHVAATTGMGFGLALLAGAVAAWRGPRAGAAVYSLGAVTGGLWYARYAVGPGKLLAGTGVSAGVLLLLDLAAERVGARVRASGFAIAPYRPGFEMPSLHGVASRLLAACAAPGGPGCPPQQ